MVGWVHHYSSLDVYGITLVSQVGICVCSPHKMHCNDYYDIIMYNAQFFDCYGLQQSVKAVLP